MVMSDWVYDCVRQRGILIKLATAAALGTVYSWFLSLHSNCLDLEFYCGVEQKSLAVTKSKMEENQFKHKLNYCFPHGVRFNTI